MDNNLPKDILKILKVNHLNAKFNYGANDSFKMHQIACKFMSN